jgi:hypothetical protein
MEWSAPVLTTNVMMIKGGCSCRADDNDPLSLDLHKTPPISTSLTP